MIKSTKKKIIVAVSGGFDPIHVGLQLLRTALRRWGIAEAGLRLLKMRENAVFRVDRAAAPPVVPRIPTRVPVGAANDTRFSTV